MHLSHYHLFAVIMFLSTLIPSVALGQANPRIMLEKSQSHALDNKVRAFRVPVTNSTGVVTYYDVTVTLGVGTTGVVSPTAAVTATRSLSVTTGVIPPGTYVATDGTRCVVTNFTLTNGRIQSFFSCNDNGAGGAPHQLSIATGLVSAGHPFLTDLIEAGIHVRPDVNTYTWGLTTNGALNIGTCNGFSTGYPIGAKTNGNQLILSLFYQSAPSGFYCSATFTKLP
ncbi:MAG: hypothetical protein HOP18_10495 [Deltaproteobacteria bacterium]|nr:hypothetical protein [Deltaproteobacteria bacterium]